MKLTSQWWDRACVQTRKSRKNRDPPFLQKRLKTDPVDEIGTFQDWIIALARFRWNEKESMITEWGESRRSHKIDINHACQDVEWREDNSTRIQKQCQISNCGQSLNVTYIAKSKKCESEWLLQVSICHPNRLSSDPHHSYLFRFLPFECPSCDDISSFHERSSQSRALSPRHRLSIIPGHHADFIAYERDAKQSHSLASGVYTALKESRILLQRVNRNNYKKSDSRIESRAGITNKRRERHSRNAPRQIRVD
jgi:hypothetical protein